MNCLEHISSPQLQKIHSGKVRESFRIDQDTRMIVVTDRLSAFDNVLKSSIPYKGTVLNSISNFWFEETKDIIGNHLIKSIDPNINLVKEAEPIRIEMIVRGYLTGSMWRGYQKGKRVFSGIEVDNGMIRNQKFESPLVTPTTKEDSDREITPEDIVAEGWTSTELYQKMTEVSLSLFNFGTKLLADKGIILVDTKYEFGLVNDELILIDEIHTPDSSRFWSSAAYIHDSDKVEQIDKEYVRQWLLANKKDGVYPDVLPDEVIKETSKRYIEIYEIITGKYFKATYSIKDRIRLNLCMNNIIKDGYVIIVMGSPADLNHARKIRDILNGYDVFTDLRIVSAHKNGERIPLLTKEYNNSIEPGVVIAVAGRSNGLGGSLAANLAIPVINCPPFKDKMDFMVNINSSLQMPSNTPAMTVVDTNAAARAALRALNLNRLKVMFIKEISDVKAALIEADKDIRNS